MLTNAPMYSYWHQERLGSSDLDSDLDGGAGP